MDNSSDIVTDTLQFIHEQLGIELRQDEHFNEVKVCTTPSHEGKLFFSVELEDRPHLSEKFSALQGLAKSSGRFAVEQNGLMRAAIILL